MLAAIVEVTTLLELVVFSFTVAVGFVVAFSLGVFGIMRFSDLRSERLSAAIGHATLGVFAFAIALAAVAFGIYQIAN